MKFVKGLAGSLGDFLGRCMAAAERGMGAVLGIRDSKAPDEVDMQFLPAALEIVASPPSPVGRAVGATIIVLFGVALAWASLGKIDVVVTAPGKIVSSSGTKLIQPFETSIIKAIDVRDGQQVKVGDPLIELDSTITNADVAHLRNDLLASQLDVARLRAALVEDADSLASFRPPDGVTKSLLDLQRQLLLDQLIEQKSKLTALDRQRLQKEAERTTVSATIEKLQTTIPFIEQRVDIRKGLADKELGSKIVYLETIQQLNESWF